MKKINRINKKMRLLITISLSLSVIGLIAIPVFADRNIISEGISKVEDALHADPHSTPVKRKEERPKTLTQDITTPPQTDNPIEKIKAKADEHRKHRLHQQDEYHYVQKDVEQLLLSGATLEDIYRSDEIGNQLLVIPRDLIKKKHEGKQNWDEIESTETDQKDKQLSALMKKHPDLESKFSGQTISPAEQVEILQHIEMNPDQSSDDAIASFHKEGRSGLQKLQGKANIKGGK